MSILSDISKKINRFASLITIIDKTDLSGFGEIQSGMDEIITSEALPGAFHELARRTSALISNILLEETPFESGLSKVCESIEKMQKELGKRAEITKENISNEQSGLKQQPVINKEDKDLLIKFASQQQSNLEDFEAYILEYEKGNTQADNAIRRILHTWKGEFGVLDLQQYSSLIHQLEDRFTSKSIDVDKLLKFKDLLSRKFEYLAKGIIADIDGQEYDWFLSDTSTDRTDTEQKKENVTEEHNGRPLNIEHLDTSLLKDFITEAKEHICSAEENLLELEKEASGIDNINTVFRAWHTIKGVAGFLELKDINQLAHLMESVIDDFRKGNDVLGNELIDALLEGNDCIKNLVSCIENLLDKKPYKTPQNYDAIINRLNSLLKNTEADKDKLGGILIEDGGASKENVRNALNLQKDGDKRKIGEILVQEEKIEKNAVKKALEKQNVAREGTEIEESIRVPVSKIDSLVDTIGEVVIAQSMINASSEISKIKDQVLHNRIARSNLMMRQIQETAMSLRMVSVKTTFQKMARLARDLSRKSNKEIEFCTEGENTELDKTVVEKIGDPLIHMIRNSLDHGIETRDERIANGKGIKAKLKLSAYHRAGSIFIELCDDGRGLDKNKILKKAIDNKLCSSDENLSDDEIHKLIFMPGFSTATEVTDISGRGVGMDVVKRNIEALRGTIEINTEYLVGTTFTIRLPLTLAVVDGMVITCQSETYVIPTLTIIETIRPDKKAMKSIIGEAEVIDVRGELIPIIYLALALGHEKICRDDDFVVMVVEDLVGRKAGLIIDSILGQQQVVVKNLGAGMGEIPGVTGGAIMNDGSVSLIIDIGGIIRNAFNQ
ncbi:chemotaxis protein CheA [Chitinispirillales bacterium ANBcel5]|uniref:chemotaxis protein CheA n=1 Tax=Cellulosispirillum alkaliphilum TaxID=3039283 RepID=UPI002A511727|nr:chemotaxis protein CheA [Chitinispirillales bacterium ANBcel5]